MNAPRSAKLYSPQLLALATQLANFPMTDDLSILHEARSQTCGSTIKIGLAMDSNDRIDRIGLNVAACAVGQAAGNILASQALGKTASDIAVTLNTIERWLEGEGALPDWQGIEALEPARAYHGRHGAILLPWQAANGALSLNSKPS